MMDKAVHVVGGGLAGSEAAWQIADICGAPVVLHEMRPDHQTAVHKGSDLAELVCSNSLRSDDWAHNAVGLLHAEMRRCRSLIMSAADANQVPAGGALAVDRDGFAACVTERLENHPRITVVREEVVWPPQAWDNVVVATGPLTSPALSQALLERTGEDALAFFDAIAPIVHLDSIDMAQVWRQSRYDKEGPGGDAAAYINCPMDKGQYEGFVKALIDGPKSEFKDWERDTPYFDGCLPIEVMAERGLETLRFGPMKPVGLTNPHKPDQRPYAVVQLRQDNALGTLYNLVGFQTKLKHGAQASVFRTIPGLENAIFARLGGLHRNTFLNAPVLLDQGLRLKADPRLRFAGQITGVEGYVESAATGILAGRFAAADRLGRQLDPPSGETALGALLRHITGGHMAGGKASFQPMNINYGLLPPLDTEDPKRSEDGRKLSPIDRGRAKKQRLSERALSALELWLRPQMEAA